jgi:hypothetical protein
VLKIKIKIKIKIKSRSSASRLKPVPLGDRGVAAGTKTLHAVLFC